jgi:glycogen(starch) synthase
MLLCRALLRSRAVRIALVSRELYPYVGGGIAPIVAAAARQLSASHEVTVVTSQMHRAQHEQLARARDPRLLPDTIRLVWVPEPPSGGFGAYFSYMHCYSANAYRALREAYPNGAPDVIEFCDYLAEGFVTTQARHTSDPWLEGSLVCVRLHTTSEICSVLDGHLPDDFHTVAIHDAERYALRHADRLLWSGGDVLATYKRFYGAGQLAPGVRIPDAYLNEIGAHPPAPLPPRSDGRPLRLLYIGRAERRKGVQNLIRAMVRMPRPDVQLELLGGDTLTGPLQTSVREQLELMIACDDRIRLLDEVPRYEVAQHIDQADAIVVPSLWECWPNVGRQALLRNRPILATPVGGLTDMVRAGVSGWLTRDTSVAALADAIERLAGARHEIDEMVEAGGPRGVFEELTDPAAFVAAYEALAAEPAGRTPARRRRREPVVSVVVPYFKLDEHLPETLDSVRAQTHGSVEVIVANDGSLRREDEFLFDLDDVTVVTQPNAGLSQARNFGIAHARGEYVLPLDADDVISPSFVTRCVDALERDRDLAYATTWVQFMEPDSTPLVDELGGYSPFGNWSRLIERNNVGGTCSAVFRRRVFELGFRYSPDLTSYEDWLLYYQLHRGGYHGAVIPERLFHYRVRPASMMRVDGQGRTGLIFNEIKAHVRESEVEWVASRT